MSYASMKEKSFFRCKDAAEVGEIEEVVGVYEETEATGMEEAGEKVGFVICAILLSSVVVEIVAACSVASAMNCDMVVGGGGGGSGKIEIQSAS